MVPMLFFVAIPWIVGNVSLLLAGHRNHRVVMSCSRRAFVLGVDPWPEKVCHAEESEGEKTGEGTQRGC